MKNETTTFEQIQKISGRVRDDGRVFFTPTIYKDKAAIRAAISNWQTNAQDIELAMNVLQSVCITQKIGWK